MHRQRNSFRFNLLVVAHAIVEPSETCAASAMLYAALPAVIEFKGASLSSQVEQRTSNSWPRELRISKSITASANKVG